MASSLQLLAKFCHVFCFYILFLSFCTSKYGVHGARELASYKFANQKKSLLTASPCSASAKGPQISTYGQSRARSLASTPSNDFPGDVPGLGTKLTLQKSSLANGNFAVKVGFGTPKRDLTLMFDTGSSLTWIQCLPCHNCYDQEEPKFDPLLSSTFSNATCTTPTCPSYNLEYHDKSYSIGYYARDTLTFSSADVFPNVVFGCGQNSSATFGRVAGVLGIGQGDTSIMSQTMEDFGQLFCYCLPSDDSNGYVVFGIEALRTCQPEFTIPLNPDLKRLGHYFVKLVGITIGQKRLELPSNVASSLLATTIIDSGTIISRLPGSVYSQLRSTFEELMLKYPRAPPSEPMDTCYNLEGFVANSSSIIPPMTLHFDDSRDLNLEPSAVVLKDSDSQVCLAFAPNDGPDDLPIIGNHQQRNVKIYYDILGKQLGFTMNGCNN